MRKIILSEHIFSNLFNVITEKLNMHVNDDKTATINYTKSNYYNPKDKNDTSNVVIDKDKIYLHPQVVKLNKSKLDCYALYDFAKTELNQAIKKDRWGKKGGAVTWANDSKEMFLNDSIGYFKALINNVYERLHKQNKDLTVGWITYPSSSSNFNEIMCNKIINSIKTQEGMKDCKLVTDLFFKNNVGIKVDEDMAILLGCDANDIANLEQWSLKTEYSEIVWKIRDAIFSLLSQSNAEEKLQDDGIDTDFYNWTRAKNKKVNDTKSTYYSNNNFYTHAKKRKFKNALNDNNDSKEINLSDGKVLDVPNNIFNIMNKIKTNIDVLIEKYENFDELMSQVDKKRNERNSDKSKSNKFRPLLKNYENEYNELSHDSDGKYKYLDRVQSASGNWEIKAKGEFARRILKNLFRLNDEKMKKTFKETDYEDKLIIVFDDNVAGGSTMDNVCYELEMKGWMHIMPLTLCTMTLSDGGFSRDVSKQKERDKRAGFNLHDRILNKERGRKIFDMNGDDNEEIHNVNQIYNNPNYDYNNISNSNVDVNASYQNMNKYDKATEMTPGYIKRGRKPTSNFVYGKYKIDNVRNINSMNDLVQQLQNQGYYNIKQETLNSIYNRILNKRQKLK